MGNDEIKKVIDATEKEHQNVKQEKAKEKVKEIVTEYLKRIDGLDTKIDELQSEKRQLKLTLDDLKSGKLEILKERLEKDEKARKVNTIEIHEIHIHHDHYNPYYTPWVINYPVYPTAPLNPVLPFYGNGNIMCTTTAGYTGNALNCATIGTVDSQFIVNGSECKSYSVGTYSVGANVVNFR